MAIRSMTTVRSQWVDDGQDPKDEWETNANIYIHYDGQPDGVGQDLFDFLDGLVVVNGIREGMPSRYANGPSKLAAQLVAYMDGKGMQPGLEPSGWDMGQEYHYQIDVIWGQSGGTFTITVFDGPAHLVGQGGEDSVGILFDGNVMDFGSFVSTYDEDSDEDDDEDEDDDD